MENKIVPVYLQIEKDLREKIEKGQLKIGTRLTEKELTRIYKVSRLTLRKSLSLLASDGYLYQVPHRGTIITSPDDPSFKDIRDARLKKLNKGIGILVSCVTGYLYPGIIRGVEDVCESFGYHLVIGNYDAIPTKEKKYMETFVQRGISGLVIAPSYNSHLNPYYKTLKEKNVPFVLVDVEVKGIKSDIVSTNNFKGAYEGVKKLISSGCRNILFLSTSLNASSTKERLSGYKQALEEAKISFKKEFIKSDESRQPHEFAYKITKDFLNKNKIDGIFSANEPLIFGVLKAIKDKGMKIPDDIKIVSFDKPEIPLELAYPITFITQPRYQIGKTACELLLERIKEKRNKTKIPYKKILLEPELVEANVKENVLTEV